MTLQTYPQSLVYVLRNTFRISFTTTCGSDTVIPFLVTSAYNVDKSSVSRGVEGSFLFFNKALVLLPLYCLRCINPEQLVAVPVNEQKLFLECLEYLNVLVTA
jgi:hypothetical protein